MSIVKYDERVPAAFAKAGMDEIQVGDIYINCDSYYHVMKITSVYFDEKMYKKIGNKESGYHIIIKYSVPTMWDCSAWDDPDSHVTNMAEINIRGWYKLERGKSPADYVKEALDLIEGKTDISAYSDTASDVVNSETALVTSGSKEALLSMQRGLEERKHKAELVKQFVGLEMERRKAELSKIREQLGGVLAEFKKKIEKIMKVITTIELYLGIHEELFQIQEGDKAPASEPITFRQQVLYMDEEIGHWENGGLDFTNIDWFDNWLVKDENFKKLVPEQKCMVVFRPRRYDKAYNTGSWYQDALLNNANKTRTYLLIRNGECLYRVYTENIVILPRLFPKRDELAKLLAEVQKEVSEDGWRYSTKEKQEKVEDMMYQYKKRAILMQGLIDRTEVFHPLPAERVSIFNLDELGDKVRFIYDDEETLPTGRLSFNDWQASINDKLQKGSRVMVCNGYDKYAREKRIYYYTNEYNVPPSPSVGVYEVEEYEQEHSRKIHEYDTQVYKEFAAKYPRHRLKESYNTYGGGGKMNVYWYYRDAEPTPELTILHNPKDRVYGSWGDWKNEERKKRIRFRIKKTDTQLLNYDQITLEDLDFYLTSRVDRPNYLHMMPVLQRAREERLEELESEKGFVRLVIDRAASHQIPEKDLSDMVWSLVDWWKTKNVWKRPIEKDDAKALRMIEKELQRKLFAYKLEK